LAQNFGEAFAFDPVADMKGEGDKNNNVGKGGETDIG
jgi:hypothetical protein